MRRLIAWTALLCLLVCTAPALGEGDLLKSAEQAVTDVDFQEGWNVTDQHRVFYEVFVGSFSDSNGDGIGDLRGIINRMDYLNDGDPQSGKSLGVEGLWLTPVFSSPSYHKYDVTDYYSIDPAFGTMDDLKELISLCHERNVMLILDLPINHTGSGHRWYRNFMNAHLTHNPENAQYDFYSWIDGEDTAPAGRRFIPVSGGIKVEANFSDSMPELNFDNPAVREALLDVASFYLEMGIDGFRFDAAKYLYLGDNSSCVAFWNWYIGELKRIRPDVYTVAEVWDAEGVTDQYASCVNCFNFFTSQAEGLIAETAKGGDVNRWSAYLQDLQSRLAAIRADAMNIPFIANHDTDRAAGYLTVASGRMQMAANLYLLSPGSPFIYYGEEIGLRGSRGGASTDANRRLAMLWGDGDTVRNPAGSTYDKQTEYTLLDLYGMRGNLPDYYKRLLLIRKANPEIARGTLTALSFPESKAGGFTSTWNDRTVAVIHNPTQRFQTLDLRQATDLSFTRISAFIGCEEAEASLENGILTLGPQTSAVLR